MRRCLQSLALLVLIGGPLAAAEARTAEAQDVDVAKAATVKAAYLLNFVRYTQWPDNAFEHPDSPIVVTAVGRCDVGNALSEVVRRSEPIGGHPVVLQQTPEVQFGEDPAALFAALERSHLIYVCSLTPERVQSILQHVSGSKALTVGDTPDFAGSGGMFGFVLRENRILFEANPEAIQKSPLNVSAKVLKLAQIVGKGADR